MGVFLNSGFTGFISSIKKTATGYFEDFVDGFLGYGWKLWEHKKGKYKLTIDNVTVRDTFLVYEMLVSKIRAIKGSLVISQANGKIKEVEFDGVNYFITLEEDNSFVNYDIVRCKAPSKTYWIDCLVMSGKIVLSKAKLGNAVPEVGDDIVQFGNTTNKDRQSLIYLHCDEGGQPTIQLLNGVNSTNLTNCTKVLLDDKGFYTENGEIKNLADNGDVIYWLKKSGDVILANGNAVLDANGNITLNNATLNNLEANDAIVNGEFTMQSENNFSVQIKPKFENDDYGGIRATSPNGKAIFEVINTNREGSTFEEAMITMRKYNGNVLMQRAVIMPYGIILYDSNGGSIRMTDQDFSILKIVNGKHFYFKQGLRPVYSGMSITGYESYTETNC